MKSSKDNDYDFIIMKKRHNGKDLDKMNEVTMEYNRNIDDNWWWYW